MSAVSTVKAVLEADATLLATATGGVWDYDETGRLGINRTTTPGAFGANGILKPCILVKGRSAVADGLLADDAAQYASVRETVELWLYEDAGTTAIETMASRARKDLHGVQLDGTFGCWWQQDIDGRDDTMSASFRRSDYLIVRRMAAA